MSGTGGLAKPGVGVPIEIQHVNRDSLDVEKPQDKVGTPVNTIFSEVPVTPPAVPEAVAATGADSALRDAMTEIDNAPAPLAAVDGVVSPQAAAPLNIEGQRDVARQAVAANDHMGLEKHLAAQNFERKLGAETPVGEEAPEAEVIPEAVENQANPITTAPPAVSYTASPIVPANPQAAPTLTQPSVATEPVAIPESAVIETPIAPAAPITPGIPIPPDRGPSVSREGLQQPTQRKLELEELLALSYEEIEELINRQREVVEQVKIESEAAIAKMQAAITEKDAFAGYLRALGKYYQELNYSEKLWRVRDIKIMELYKNQAEQGPAVA